MLKLRLSMGGTKKRPVYKIVVADSRFARDGRFIEKLGFYNPLLPKEKEDRIGLQLERVKYWLSQGAQPTTRVARILGEKQIIEMPKQGNNPHKAIPKKDRKKERENPKIIDGSRRKRIANGSGTDVATINKLLKQFKMMSDMMKKMSKGNLKGMTDKGIPPELFNQLK